MIELFIFPGFFFFCGNAAKAHALNAVVNSVMFRNKASKGGMLAVGLGAVWRSVGKGSLHINLFFELLGLSTDIGGDAA